MSALIGLLAFISIILFFEAYKRLKTPRLEEELARFAMSETGVKPRTFFDKHIRSSTLMLPKRFSFLRGLIPTPEIEKQLVYAGYPQEITDAEQFFGLQLFMAFTGLGVGSGYLMWGYALGWCGGPIVFILLPLAGFFGPRLWLQSKVKQRQQAINLALPDLLDMLAISVQAGMGFDQALREVNQRMRGPLHEEINRLLRELKLGEPRPKAFHRLIDRNTSEDLRLFIDALLQAEELGTPVAKTLTHQAEEIRIRRIQRAKELAGRASPQISLVTIFLVAPSALCLLLSALVLTLLQGGGLVPLTPGGGPP